MKMTDKNSARPVEILTFEPPDPDNQIEQKKTRNLWPYVALVVFVVLVVPGFFKLVDLLGGSAETQIVVNPQAPNSGELTDNLAQAPEDSPFEDALLAEARADAQEVLAELLPLRRSLEQRRASEWAAEEFSVLVSLAVEGDEFYRTREFQQSLQRYQESLLLAQDLDQRAAEVTEALIQQGYASLAGREAQPALQAFELAVAIEADNQAALSGLQRSQVLPEIQTLLNSADTLLSESRFEEARQKAEQAVLLDSEDSRSLESLALIESSILRRDFQQLMSRGYQQLASGNYEAAQAAFRSADELDPGNTAVSEALDQVAATRESDRSAELLQQARLSEQTEQWSTAQANYQQLLEEDPNRVEARIELVKVEARLNLEQQILQHINNPLRLKDDNLWNQAEETLRQAQSINNPGPVLRQQIADLSNTLRKARTPVRLEVVSDGATQVSVLGVSNLGFITAHPLDLNPGEYVVIGKKSGFQDIRQEVVLSGDESRVVVNVVPTRSLESL